jgi:hypothetical protein
MSEKHQDADTEEDLVEDSIIPEEDFREAIAACRQDPELDLYFKMAPRGAKLFIGLVFYSTHFGDKVDPRQYAECQAEIEPALSITDLTYLIRFERDKETKKYLRALLAQRKRELSSDGIEPAAPIPSSPPPAPPAAADVPIAPPKRTIRRQAASTPTLRSEGAEEVAGSRIPTPVKIAAAAGLLLVIGLAVYFSQRTADEPSSRQPAVASDDSAEARARALARLSRPGTRQPVEGVRVEDMQFEEEPTVASADDEAGETPSQGTEAPSEPAPSAAPQETPTGTPRPGGVAARVVFTDGKKIVRRPGGVVEVPRVFSCAGAGVKPFWVYGAHPEAEAAKEMKAREEWQALVRQAEKGNP